MAVYNFRDGLVPTADFTVVTANNGQVSANVADNGTLIIDSGGVAANDLAGLVRKTPIDMSKRTRISMRIRDFGAGMGAYSYNILGLYENTTEPTIMTTAERSAQRMMEVQDQFSTSPGFARRQFRFVGADAGNPLYHWRSFYQDWSTTFIGSNDVSNDGVERDSYYTLTLIIDGLSSPKRMRLLLAGRTPATYDPKQGLYLLQDTEWVEFNNGNGTVRWGGDNVYFVLGDLVSDKSAPRDVQYELQWLEVGERTLANLTEHGATNDSPSGSFPFPYDGQEDENPSSGLLSLWTSINRYNNPSIPKGAAGWRKDFGIVYDAILNSYFLTEQRRNSGDGLSDTYISESATWPASWASDTEIFATEANKDEFFFLIREADGGDWHGFYGEEAAGPVWRIRHRSTSDPNPRTATWSVADTILTGQGGQWDSAGCSMPVVQHYEGDTYIMWYYGHNGDSLWKVHFAVSNAGIAGPYERESIGPTVSPINVTTTVDGTQNKTKALLVTSVPGFVDGDPIVTVSGQLNIIDTVSGNTLNLESRISLNNAHAVRHLCHGAIAFKDFTRVADDVWIAWATVFKLAGGEEYAWPYKGIGSADPRLCTWTPLRATDTEIQMAAPSFGVPYIGATAYVSVENFAVARESVLQPIVADNDCFFVSFL